MKIVKEMKDMKAKTTIMGVAVALAMMLSLSIVASAGTMDEGDSYETEFAAEYMSVPPTIDGEIAVNEWGNGNESYIDIEYTVEDDENYTDSDVIIYFGNDADFFYFAFDFGYMTNANDTDAVMIVWAFDVDTDDEVDASVGDEPYMMCMGNQTFVMTAFSNANALWAIGWGESENFEDDHYMAEFAIPMIVFDDEEEVGFAMMAEVDSTWNETCQYPIEGAETLVDIMSDPMDSSDWGIITFAAVPAPEPEEEDMSVTYAMYMFAIGTIIFVILLVAHKETIYKWIAQGDDKYVYISFAVGILFFALGFLQWLYDWIAMIL